MGQQGRLVAGARARQIVEAPGVAKLRGDRRVHRGERCARGRAPVGAARLGRELLERRRVELRALDRDDVDGGAGMVGGGDRVVERGAASRLVSVGHDDDHAGRERLCLEPARRADEPVVERRSLNGVDLDRAEHTGCVTRRRREVRQEQRLGGEGRDGDSVLVRASRR